MGTKLIGHGDADFSLQAIRRIAGWRAKLTRPVTTRWCHALGPRHGYSAWLALMTIYASRGFME